MTKIWWLMCLMWMPKTRKLILSKCSKKLQGQDAKVDAKVLPKKNMLFTVHLTKLWIEKRTWKIANWEILPPNKNQGWTWNMLESTASRICLKIESLHHYHPVSHLVATQKIISPQPLNYAMLCHPRPRKLTRPQQRDHFKGKFHLPTIICQGPC